MSIRSWSGAAAPAPAHYAHARRPRRRRRRIEQVAVRQVVGRVGADGLEPSPSSAGRDAATAARIASSSRMHPAMRASRSGPAVMVGQCCCQSAGGNKSRIPLLELALWRGKKCRKPKNHTHPRRGVDVPSTRPYSGRLFRGHTHILRGDGGGMSENQRPRRQTARLVTRRFFARGE
jgi:hypothetical protein